jgi:hypothetical protein
MNSFAPESEKLVVERIAGFLIGIGLGTAIGFFLRHAAVTARKESRGSGRL